jgi:hypothetical protein
MRREGRYRKLIWLAKELPAGRFKTRAIREYTKAHCVEMFRGPVMMYDSNLGYTCVGHSYRNCLWIPAEDVKATGIDDGVF